MKFLLTLVLIISGVIFTPIANSALIIQYEEVDGDLLFTWSGFFTFNVSKTNSGFSPISAIGQQGISSVFYASTTPFKLWNTYSDVSTTSNSFFTQLQSLGHLSVGDNLMFRLNNANELTLWGALEYKQLSNISGNLTVKNTSIGSSGIRDWSAIFNSGSDKISFQAVNNVDSPVSVFEPKMIGLFFIGLIFLGAVRELKQSSR